MPEPQDASQAADVPLRPRRSGVLALGLGLAALIAAGVFALQRQRPPASHIKVTAGFSGTTRALVAGALCEQVARHAIRCEVVATEGSESEVESLVNHKADFALISDAYRIEPEGEIRVVAPLQLEALQLVVKAELADAVTEDLAALNGHSVDLGPADSATAELADEVLDFAGVRRADAAGQNGILPQHLAISAIDARAERRDRAALPDAIFHLATVPSVIVRDLVHCCDYRLVPLPFAEALRLSAVIASSAKSPLDPTDLRRLVAEVVLPPFLYQTKPAVPAAPLPTIGARLRLVTREDVSPETVEAVLDAVFDARFAHLLHPPLDRDGLARLPHSELHPGAIAFLARNDSAITNETFDELSNSLSILGALFGGGAFLVQGWRQRRRAERDMLIADHLRRVIELDRQVVEIQLSSDLNLDALIAIQRELLQLKGETLDRFTRGEIDGRTAMADLLVPIRALSDDVGELLMHVREKVESQARAEGREASDVWDETAEKSSDDTDG